LTKVKEKPEFVKLAPESDPYLDGFNLKTVLGAFFVGLVMMPASIYLMLFSGTGLGDAPQWVTIIIFVELARRSLKTLSKQEIYVLYYTASGMVGGGAFAGLIWQQYLRQSREATEFGVAKLMPLWAAPAANSPGILNRQLWHHDWWLAIGVILIGQVLIRLNWYGLSYALFRLTSDVERLPFPLARMTSEGSTALAEAPEKKESWRWRVFSVGSMIGLVFGVVYIGVPAVTGLFFSKPVEFLAIPWQDFTTNVEGFLPSGMVNLTFDLGNFFWGMIMPYWMVVGQFLACLATSVFGNPILQHFGFFPTWKKGMNIISTSIATQFDFYLSITIGLAIAVAVIGVWDLVKAFRKKSTELEGQSDIDIMLGTKTQSADTKMTEYKETGVRKPEPPRGVPAGRGDFPIWVSMLLFVISTGGFVGMCHWLVPGFPLPLLMVYGFVWTPIMSYISARMTGLTGNSVGFPYVKESSFILSGYKGVDIWFAPIPLNDFGGSTMMFKTMELTKTKFTSIVKAELLMFPIGVVCSFLFWAFFWSLSSIPSNLYPFVDKIWPFQAINQSLYMTATLEGRSFLLEALKPAMIAAGFLGGLGMYGLVAVLKGSSMLFYGAALGVGAMPGAPLLQLLGALLGRYYFAKRFGNETWYRYIPILSAGFACGVGLVGMLAVGITMVSGSVLAKPF
jgi:hypothetical protein